MDYIYLDNDAATKVDERVLEAMLPFYTTDYGMASSEFGHSPGVTARRAIESARETIAKEINAKASEIFFTSGVAESNNWAVFGALGSKKGDVFASAIEQNTVLNACEEGAKEAGTKFVKLPVTKEGIVGLKALKSARIVSIQHANQEMGAIQDIKKAAKLAHDAGALFHTDASHSFLKLPIDVEAMDIDLMTISAHDIYGPKGIGALYVKEGTDIAPLLYGGGEQKGMRPGLEDVPSIVGFGKAVEVYDKKDNERMEKLRDRLIEGLLKIKDTELNGPKERLANNANITFKYVEGESILLHLDMRGIGVTTGSACFSRELMPSHVISAMGKSHAEAHGSVRFSLSKWNTKEEIDYVIKNSSEVVEKLREISPFGGSEN